MMQKMIRKIARGEIYNPNTSISFSAENIAIEVFEDEVYEGEFFIEFKGYKTEEIGGKVFSTNCRMKCINSEVIGNKQCIRYCFDAKGLRIGNNSTGEFYFIVNHVETSLHFHVTVVEKYVNSAIGKLYNLDEFVQLSKANWNEALRIFYSPFFTKNILEKTKVQYKNKLIMIYDGLNIKEHNSHNMEEFLIASGKKEKIDFDVAKNKYNFFGVTDKIKEYIEIHKTTWGYLEFTISTDSDFIELCKTKITTDDFMGTTLQYAFYLSEEKMHEGKNFGKIILQNVNKKIEVEVIAQKNDDFKEIVESVKHQIKDYKVGLMELYVQYRLKRIGTGAWANETLNILHHLMMIEKNNKLFYKLMMAQIYIYNHEIEKANAILDQFDREVDNKNIPEYGYYLFLHTLFEREPANVDECEEKIEKLYKQYPGNVILFWALSFLNAKYIENPSEKFKALKYWDGVGKNSPYIFSEAYYIIWQDPFLLDKIDDFETKVLIWALRNKAFTEEVMDQFFLVANTVKKFDFKIFSIMEEGYKNYPKENYLSVICSYLIKAQKYGEKYHKWYELGVNYNLRITKLYEAFLLSATDKDMTELPDMVKRYFQYENNIPKKKLAMLYKNIILEKDSDPATFEKYKDIIRNFAFEELKKKHINENYAIIYQEIFRPEIINLQITNFLSNLLFTNKIIVKSKEIVRIYVYENWKDAPLEIGLNEGEGYFYHISDEYEIIFEDREGKRYGKNIEYEIKPLFNLEKYKKVIMDSVFQNQNYFMYVAEKGELAPKNEYEELDFLENGDISEKVLNQLYYKQVVYYDKIEDTIKCSSYLKKINNNYISREKVKRLAEFYVKYKEYGEAVELLKRRGIDLLKPSDEVGITRYLINNGGTDNKMIIDLSLRVFKSGHYNEEIIEFLCLNYNGPTTIMANLWSIAHDITSKTNKLEENILSNIIYTSIDLPMKNKIFKNYCEHDGRKIIIEAYLTKMMYDFFADNNKITEYIVRMVENIIKKGLVINDICKLGLIKYYSIYTSLEENEEFIDKIIEELLIKDLKFEFYKSLPNKIVEKYHIKDKVYIEFKGEEHENIMIEYKISNGFETSESQHKPNIKAMREIYNGIYCVGVTAFFGETISYKIFTENNEGYKLLKNNTINNYDLRNTNGNNRYNRLNDIVITSRLKEKQIEKELSDYQNLDELTTKIFTVI
ncbi:DUF5717 family protein [Lachnobacterium bovis]|uniref:DUF5717 family protein n=1 Tax=Lachnobacterium bovis TaxID=140626 RepID=UPI00048CBD1E|nr:DUF5717 family protein [Lachnobacterium bovis]